jgi:DNA-binding PadR family transcriptional regulator
MARKPLDTLTETMFYVLMALVKGERCGTEIAAYIDGRTKGRVRLGPGTLYTILAAFEEKKLIEEIGVAGRKRTYRITDIGTAIYNEELERLQKCVADSEREAE